MSSVLIFIVTVERSYGDRMLHQPVVSSFLGVNILVYDKASKRVAVFANTFLAR
jgi:hypothetical protein